MAMKWKIVRKLGVLKTLIQSKIMFSFLALAFCKTKVTLLGSTTKKNATQHEDLHKKKS